MLHISLKHILLFSILILFFLAISEAILIVVLNKQNSKQVVYVQDSHEKYAKLNSLYAKLDRYHVCPNNGSARGINNMVSFYELKIINSFDKDLTNWCVEIKLNGSPSITGCWNGDGQLKNNILRIKSNQKVSDVIKSNSSYTFETFLNSAVPISYDYIKITGNHVFKLSKNPIHIVIVILAGIIVIALAVYTLAYLSMNREIKILNRISERSDSIIEQTMKTFVNFIDAKDQYTKGHSTRVAEYCRVIAERMGFDKQFLQDIYYMGLMHDVGKIMVPENILNKTSHLTPNEWDVIKMHTENGAKLLQNFTAVPEIRQAVLYHHERYDGKGYMSNLKGEDIPIYARIICVADSFDAMNTNRCYRLKYSKERIIKEFQRCAGHQFDPAIAGIMIELIKDGSVK